MVRGEVSVAGWVEARRYTHATRSIPIGGVLTMNNGYWQRLLRVDLTNAAASVEPIAEDDLKQFIGGAGLGAEILRREVPAKSLVSSGHDRG